MEEPKYHLQGVVKSREQMEDFDGPLDVILLLLSKNKIEIRDVQITQILEQYLAYLEERKRMDLEIASEFIAMASHLIYIKSKMLLSAADQQEALSEMELLIRSLEERQRKEALNQIRQAQAFLTGRDEIGRSQFTKQPEPLQKQTGYRYRHEKEDLLRAMARMAQRSAKQLPPPASSFVGIVGAEPFPVVKKAAQVLKRLVGSGTARFRQLFSGNRSRSEVVATFLALLELCRMKSVRIEEESDGETTVTFLQMPEEQMTDEEAAK